EQQFDCVILSPRMSSMSGELLAAGLPSRAALGQMPVIVYGDGEFANDEDGAWKRLEECCTVRRVQSPDRLLDLTTLVLHRAVGSLPAAKRQLLVDLHHADKLPSGKKVLIVDDDMRNIFALSSVLEEHDMAVISSDNGRDAIKLLRHEPNIDIVLMDIMMPEMDGMET